ncbi:hypothetical protein SFRURICE_005640 [Spodoptera frugiperda]|nr:hypothetical protein SFRURICE_005640 [Spodoptera frugiperda]
MPENQCFRPLPHSSSLIMDIVIVYPAHYRTTVGQWLDTLVPRRYIDTEVQLHGKRGVQNLMLVDFYMKFLVYAEGIGRASKFFSETYLKIMSK